MDAELKRKWLEALRSGKYKQGRKKLRIAHRDGTESFCCLGVLCVVAGKAIARSQTLLGGDLQDEVDGHENDLIRMNDKDRWPFAEIADYIEANL